MAAAVVGTDVSIVTLADTSWVSPLSTTITSGADCRSFSLKNCINQFETKVIMRKI